ncbi:acyltransferase family protein [Nocardia sp. NPDC051787]|uniref:acyltransferase family protein n=1 Tax=Nocardia sp. NPDC051787 TaxID=3155415 RepID=UPI0034484FDF
MLAASLTIDALRFTGSGYAEWNLLFVWLFCHQLGVLHARRTLHPVPDAGLLAIVAIGIAALVAMVLAGPYPPTMYGVAAAAVSNLAPPTAAISILAVIQLAVFTFADRRMRTWERRGSAGRVIDYVSARLMTIYLWHIPVIAAVTGAALSAPALLLPRDPHTWWLTRPLWVLGCGIVLLGVVRLMTSLASFWRPPCSARPAQ